jgi:hypothetical protein
MHLMLGNDALKLVQDKLNSLGKEIEHLGIGHKIDRAHRSRHNLKPHYPGFHSQRNLFSRSTS